MQILDKIKEQFNGIITAVKTKDKDSLTTFAIIMGFAVVIISVFKIKLWKNKRAYKRYVKGGGNRTYRKYRYYRRRRGKRRRY